MGENLHPEAEAPCNNSYYAGNIWLVMFLRTFGRGRPQQEYNISELPASSYQFKLLVELVGACNLIASYYKPS
jgi:hypothetical protein